LGLKASTMHPIGQRLQAVDITLPQRAGSYARLSR
jgi:hypothetical protein